MNNDDKTIKSLIHKIGLKYNLQDHIVNKIINSPYKFTRETITNLNINPDITEEEFNELKTNFIYLYIGKLHTNYRVVNKQKNQSLKLKEYFKNNKENKND